MNNCILKHGNSLIVLEFVYVEVLFGVRQYIIHLKVAQLERSPRSRRVAGSNLRELQCCHMATGSLIHKNEYLTGRDGYVFE